MSFNSALAYKHVLCMHVTSTEVHAAAVERASKKIAEYRYFPLNKYERAETDLVFSDPFFKHAYEDIVTTAGTKRSTLIPTGIFNVSKPAEIFSLNYSAPHENLDYNRLPELDIVNIFEIPLWLKTSLVMKFPRVRVLHPATVMLKGIFDQPAFHPRIHVYVQQDFFWMFITSKNKLEFFNRFDFGALSDIVYHMLFVMEQKGIEAEAAKIHVYGVETNWKDLNEFSSFFKSPVTISDQAENGQHFILAKQLLCV
ncbi:MAG: DUF3822 family protein [Crocinitomicaceae bacterium]|nr:DUF3822 family protein [Crocinitomicaceae bacterium]